MAATLGLAACGGDDDDTSSTTEVDVTVGTDDTDVTITEDTAVDDTSDTDGSAPTTGSGEVGSQDDYVAAAKEEIASEFDDQDLADCMGEAMVSDDVYAAIEEAGMTVEAFSADGPAGLGLDEAAADEVASDFAECGDLLPEIVAEEQLDCAEENISNEQVAELLAYTLLELELSADVQDASDAVDVCMEAATTTTT
jgi:hypothetical protein